MKRCCTLLLFSVIFSTANTQNNSAYPSLLWEITGNGLTQLSYLFGTMHVSNKLAFHLSDSFYHAIASCNTVSLELDPRQWQSEMFRLQKSQITMGMYSRWPNDYLRERSFRLNNAYENNIKRALSEEPYVINGLLYRTMEGQSNFQENTYLDLYVYQTARKLGKKATGVENYMESEKIQLEAQEDMIKERNRRINFNNENPYEIQRKIQEAYRRGDLSMLDSLSQLSGGSEAYNEKFLYGRNDIQANSIDSIMRKETLFVAVGAAHLPGKRGIIEILRRRGYTLRPIIMTDRNAEQRDRIDKIRVPVQMHPAETEDGFVQVKVPGKMFRRAEISFTESLQYADMENGTYYMLSRIKTHPGQSAEAPSVIMRKTDSLLYENVPGKILQKKNITINGYDGIDIVNKTRRGDIQRYHIIYTPQEVLVFKMSGNEDYVYGKEAEEFFGSIRLKETPAPRWIQYTPSSGGFSVPLPQQPGLTIGRAAEDFLDTKQYEAIDSETGNAYMIWQKSLHNYNFLEEDTLDLYLAGESLKSSDAIDKELSRRYGKQDGYTSLDIVFSLKEGGILRARAMIRGAQYYLLTARSKDAKTNFNRFFNGFRFEPFRYKTPISYTDKSIGFVVQTPVQPAIDTDLKEFLNRQQYSAMSLYMNDRYQPRNLLRNAYFVSDSTGEAIQVNAVSYPKYFYQKDTARFWENELSWARFRDDLVIGQKEYTLRADSAMMYTYVLTDTNTHRRIKCLAILSGNTLYRVQTVTDGLAQESSFIRDFFSSFQPAENKESTTIFSSKAPRFFSDLESSDSTAQKIAKSAVTMLTWEPEDFPQLQKAFYAVQPGSRDYLATKIKLIQATGYIKDSTGITERINWLKQVYTDYTDTSIYQNAALQALANTKTKHAYTVLKDILVQSPAIFDNNFEYQNLFRVMSDSLALAATLYPDMLQLMAFDDYKQPVIQLLTRLVDSSYIKANVYESQFPKLFFDAQVQARKLQTLTEREMIRTQTEPERGSPGLTPSGGANMNATLLNTYLSLLMPFYDQNPNVPKFFDKLLRSGDIQAKLASAVLFAKNNKPVPDTLWEYLAANDTYRATLYERLEKTKQLEFFPGKYKTQEAISHSLMLNNRSYYRAAEVEPMGRKYVETKKSKGYVYYFKYRLQKQGDWLIGLSGIQPADTSQVNLDRSVLNMNNRKLITNGTEQEQFEKLVNQLILAKRKSAATFYTAQSSFADDIF
jgi:uncharacterized protein YbaP (TraB family)